MKTRLLGAVAGLWIVFALLDWLVVLPGAHDAHHAETFYSGIPGFYGLFGLTGCFTLIWIAKGLGGLVQRPENHYLEPLSVEVDAGNSGRAPRPGDEQR